MASLPFCQLSTADTLVCTSRSMRVILCALLVSVRTRHQREGYKKMNEQQHALDFGRWIGLFLVFFSDAVVWIKNA